MIIEETDIRNIESPFEIRYYCIIDFKNGAQYIGEDFVDEDDAIIDLKKMTEAFKNIKHLQKQ